MAQIIPAPKHKKNWPGQFLFLGEPYPEGRVIAPLVRIVRRKNAMDTQNSTHDVSRWGNVRILAVEWRCHACGATHSGYLPESLIEPGKVDFVKIEKK